MGTRVFIGRLSYDARERDLEKFFKGFGRVKEIIMKNGFAFVEFEDSRDADDAVYELNGKDLLGERVSVEIARGPSRDGQSWGRGSRNGSRDGRGSGDWGRRPPNNSQRRNNAPGKYGPPTRTENRIIVENLSSRVSWQDLKDYMRQAGEVTYADAHKQRRNEGVVEFASFSDMKNAIDKLDNTELNGRRIKIKEKSRDRRSRSRSRSNSRSRSRSRSASRSRSHSRNRSRSKSARRSKSKSRSASKSRSRSRSPRGRDIPKEAKKRSRSKSSSKSPEHNRSSDTAQD